MPHSFCYSRPDHPVHHHSFLQSNFAYPKRLHWILPPNTMTNPCAGLPPIPEGVFVASDDPKVVAQAVNWFSTLGIEPWTESHSCEIDGNHGVRFRLTKESFDRWTPDFNTLELAHKLQDHFGKPATDLIDQETLLAMLASPKLFVYPSIEEFESSLRIRVNIALAAGKTFLSFDAYGAERPEDYWIYDEELGFLIKPDRSLIEALTLATQPGEHGTVYSFSCYRATEYVVALGVAQEAKRVNPKLYRQLEVQSQRRAIRSREFHDVFMKEYGTRESPLPECYYVPGDRIWFKNPDPASADALGFEGSWLFYIGSGVFSDFWKRDKTFTLDLKCLEIYHWRHGAYQDSEGVWRMNEKLVQERMAITKQDPVEHARVLSVMRKIQDGPGIYSTGGCVDATREYTRWVRPESCDIQLKDAQDINEP